MRCDKTLRTKTYRLTYTVIAIIAALSHTASLKADDYEKTDTTRSDSAVASFLRSNNIRITDGNDVKLFMHGHDKFVDLFSEIKQANNFINLEYFNFRNDSVANSLFDLLAEEVRRGVEVRALYDAFGNASNNKPIKSAKHDSILSTGIKLYQFDPLKFPWITHIYPRDHRKIVVIDGRTAYTGGMNVADYYIEGLPGIGPWRDVHMKIKGPAVNDLNSIFRTMWQKETGEVIDSAKFFPEPQSAGDKRLAIVDRRPHDRNKIIRHLFISMLDNAKHKVRIVNPYFVPTHSVRKAIKRTIKRGIDVEIMLSSKSDIPLTPDASHYVGNVLEKRGAKVYLFNGGFHHTKVMIVDDQFCTVGSANMDSRSLRYDYEVNTVIFNKETTLELVNMFEQDKLASTVLTRDVWKNKTAWKRFVAWFGNLLTPVL